MDEDVLEVNSTPEEESLTSDKYVWDQVMTFSLIEEYRNHLQDFLYPQGQMIRDIWEKISQNMGHRGYDVSANACDQKWRQLKKTFKFNMPNGRRKSRAKWIYYDALDDILGNEEITRRISWKQRSVIKQEPNESDSHSYFTQEETIDDDYEHESGTYSGTVKKEEDEKPPKWFQDFLVQYQEEEKQKRKMLQKMHSDLVALERQKCVLLENLIKKIPKNETVPKIINAVSLSQEMFEEEM